MGWNEGEKNGEFTNSTLECRECSVNGQTFSLFYVSFSFKAHAIHPMNEHYNNNEKQ